MESEQIYYGRYGGRTMAAVDNFMHSEHQTMEFLCVDKDRAQALATRLASLGLPVLISLQSHKRLGQPITVIEDEFSDDPIVRLVPNDAIDWSVRLEKCAEKLT